MNDSCEQVRGAAPEVALGVATGEERAAVLRHLAACRACRREVEALTELGDELLALAPEREPPAGFESRVLDRLAAEAAGRRRRDRGARWRRTAAAVAAVVVAAGAAAGTTFLATREDRELAAEYRRALSQAEGSYFGALPLESTHGRRAGLVFGYEGKPPWIFVMVTSGQGTGRYEVSVETEDGERTRLGSLRLRDGRGSFGATLPVDLFEVTALRLDGPSGAALVARAPAD